MRGISWLAANQLASQEGLYAIKKVSNKQLQLHYTQPGADYRIPPANLNPKWRMFRNVIFHYLSYLPSVINIFNYLSLGLVKAQSSHDKGNTAMSKRSPYHNPHASVWKSLSWIQILPFAFCSHSQHKVCAFSSAVFLISSPCRKPYIWKSLGPENREAVAGMRSFPYCQFPDKNSRDITRDIWSFSSVFKMFMYLFNLYSRKNLLVFCETSLGNSTLA